MKTTHNERWALTILYYIIISTEFYREMIIGENTPYETIDKFSILASNYRWSEDNHSFEFHSRQKLQMYKDPFIATYCCGIAMLHYCPTIKTYVECIYWLDSFFLLGARWVLLFSLLATAHVYCCTLVRSSELKSAIIIAQHQMVLFYCIFSRMDYASPANCHGIYFCVDKRCLLFESANIWATRNISLQHIVACVRFDWLNNAKIH